MLYKLISDLGDIQRLSQFSYQVSYLIVDEADEDLEMAEDPFTEAGISGLPGLPPGSVEKSSDTMKKEDTVSIVVSNTSELASEIPNSSNTRKQTRSMNTIMADIEQTRCNDNKSSHRKHHSRDKNGTMG